MQVDAGGSDKDFTPPAQTTAAAAKRKVVQGGSNANDGDGQVKRSRLSTRDLQLSKAVVNDRLEVAMQKAELQEAAMVKVAELCAAAKSEKKTKQLAAQRALMDEQLAAQKAMNDERLAAEMAMHAQTLEAQRQADKAATRVARESYQAQQVVDFTKMFRESGETLVEAIRLAKLAVYGSG
jgi:cell envelope opacity-associated protein A